VEAEADKDLTTPYTTNETKKGGRGEKRWRGEEEEEERIGIPSDTTAIPATLWYSLLTRYLGRR
jgi:hypothetical protein